MQLYVDIFHFQFQFFLIFFVFVIVIVNEIKLDIR